MKLKFYVISLKEQKTKRAFMAEQMERLGTVVSCLKMTRPCALRVKGQFCLVSVGLWLKSQMRSRLVRRAVP